MAGLSERLTWMWRDSLAAWRALPRARQWRIALGLSLAACVALSLSAWLVFWATGGKDRGNELAGDVTLYTSVDAFIAQPIALQFEQDTGVKVRLVTDTEATKTTALVERLFAERDRPRADVWWSGEALGSTSLADRGVLDTFASKSESDFPKGWPSHLRAPDRTWYGFAQRARVIAYNTNRVAASASPKRLRDLTDAKYAGRVGMARPQFGTARTHVAALVALHGEESVRAWLAALKDGGLRLYDGNSAVVRALSLGEIDVGLTDTDDVFAGQAQNWPIAFNFDKPDLPNQKVRGLPSAGAVVIPNTVGIVRGCPHPNEARRLADFLLSAKVEELLARSDSKNLPIRPAVAASVAAPPIDDPAPVSPADVAKAAAAADRLLGELFPL